MAIPALIILLLSHLIITIFVQFIKNKKYVPYKFNWYIILIPLVLFIMEFFSAVRKEDRGKGIEAELVLF